jgi:hypothetical protein
MRRVKRLLSLAALLILGITEMAPHRHADSLDLWTGDDIAARTEHVIRCDGPAAGATHVHRDVPREIDPCLACFRHHMNATALRVESITPVLRAAAVAVTARVASARTIQLRKSSRAPPVLPS